MRAIVTLEMQAPPIDAPCVVDHHDGSVSIELQDGEHHMGTSWLRFPSRDALRRWIFSLDVATREEEKDEDTALLPAKE